MSGIPPVDRPRYSNEPLPPYSYVPGFTPHPVSDPRGHRHGHHAATPAALDSARWEESAAYRYGVDLFNHGYYWEAHEAWESLWHAAGRSGPVAIWLKALIKLAAAAVKVREGNSAGALRHAGRCKQLLHELRAANSPDQIRQDEADPSWRAWSGLVGSGHRGVRYCGVELHAIEEIASAIVVEADRGLTDAAPTRVLNGWLQLPI
ncbi:MAG: DUF309 domain-containing protein [Pirellulales bacterium]|nr:DUF309 domain-containing protein [Pirellulales bacterium]